MSSTVELREAWRKRRVGEVLNATEAAAINEDRRRRVKHDLYFEDAEHKERLQVAATAAGYRNFSRWLLDMAEQGIASEGVDQETLDRLAQDAAGWRERHDKLDALYVEAASTNHRLQEDNRRLAAQLGRLLDAVLEDGEDA